MATYFYVSATNTLRCTGTDITTAGIKTAIDATPALGTATHITTAAKSVFWTDAKVHIGSATSGPTASIYAVTNEILVFEADNWENYGRIQLGTDNSGDSDDSCTLVLDMGFTDSVIFQASSELEMYGGIFYCERRARSYSDTILSFIDVDFQANDSITNGEADPSSDGMTIDYTDSRIHHANAVGIKAFTRSATTQASITLNNSRIEGCLYAVQFAAEPVFTGSARIEDAKWDTCTNHVVGFIDAGIDVAFVNPDFTNGQLKRPTSSFSAGDAVSVQYRYSIKVTEVDGTNIEDATVKLVDEQGTTAFEELTLSTGIPDTTVDTLEAYSYAHNGTGGLAETSHKDHILLIRRYGYNWVLTNRSALADLDEIVSLTDRSAVTETQVAALAHTGISITDHGGTPVTWQSLDFGITVTGNLTTNPSLTAANIFHALQAHLEVETTYNGKNGTDWHPLVTVGSSGYETFRSDNTDYYYSGTVKGVRVIDEAGNSFPGISRHQADNGSYYVVPLNETLTIRSDTASTLIRYFEDDSQTVVDSTTGTSLAYVYPDTDPIDIELVKQSYVPVNRQNVTPFDGDYDVEMDFDEAYNSGHGLTITSEFDYNRATKLLTINSDQEALDVRSALADTIRTNSSYYNTSLLMEAIPGLTRIDLIDGMTITSMATWKGAGMEMFDSADSANPVEKWFCLKSLADITGASIYYRQTSSGSATAGSLTSGVVDEAFQYWSDPNHDGSTADGYDYSGYMVIKSMLPGSKEGRVDVVVASGLSALQSNLYTIGLSNAVGGYSGLDPGVTANLTLIAGGIVGGETFAYEWVDGATTSSADIANQIHYNKINIPNTVIAGGTGLTWWEISDSVIFNGSNVETERGYEEGATPTLVGFYVSRSSADHPGFSRFQADNGNYYIPATVAQLDAPNLTAGTIQVLNESGRTASAWAATTAYSAYDKILRSTGTGSESGVGLYFQCTTAGTTGGTEPTWDTTPGNTTADGTAIWTCRAIEFVITTTTSGYSNSWTDHEDFDNGDTIRLRWIDEDDLGIEATGIATTDGTTSFLNTPVDDTTHNTYAIDGSTVAEYTADFPNVQVDVNDPDNLFYLDRFYAWFKYILTTPDGIRNFFGGVTAVNPSNLIINNSIVDIFFDNVKTTSARQGDQIVVRREDGVYPQADPTSGGGGLGFYYAGIGYTAETGVSGLTAEESNVVLSDIPAIKAKSDQLGFTVANHVDANIHYVNDDGPISGSGTTEDPWGP